MKSINFKWIVDSCDVVLSACNILPSAGDQLACYESPVGKHSFQITCQFN